jgi:starvation-inducible DNA-binding protein
MAKSTAIGLDKNYSQQLAEKLNTLLAHYSIFYQNTRGFHWNIKGDKFFELHVKFEELYNDLLLKIDEVAERILTLGHTPMHNYSQYSKLSAIKESKLVADGTEAVKEILESFKVILILQREILEISEKDSDEGTNALMSDYIKTQEKLVWMYGSFLGK